MFGNKNKIINDIILIAINWPVFSWSWEVAFLKKTIIIEKIKQIPIAMQHKPYIALITLNIVIKSSLQKIIYSPKVVYDLILIN